MTACLYWFCTAIPHASHPRCCSELLLLMGNEMGMCLPLDYTALAINLFAKPLKKIRRRVELEELYL